MKAVVLIVLGIGLSTPVKSQTLCARYFGNGWITNDIHYDTTGIILNVDTISFRRPTRLDDCCYSELHLNCTDSTYQFNYLDTVFVINPEGAKELVHIQTSPDNGIGNYWYWRGNEIGLGTKSGDMVYWFGVVELVDNQANTDYKWWVDADPRDQILLIKH